MTFSEFAAIGTALAASFTDVKWRRIPNLLTFGAAGAALLFHLITGGPTASFWALVGWCAGVVIFMPFFMLEGLGGGDVKLLAALGAWLGPGAALSVALYGSIVGGVLALGIALWAGYLGRAFSNLWMLAGYWRVAGVRPHPALTLDSTVAPHLPYALPIASGLLVTLWLR